MTKSFQTKNTNSNFRLFNGFGLGVWADWENKCYFGLTITLLFLSFEFNYYSPVEVKK